MYFYENAVNYFKTLASSFTHITYINFYTSLKTNELLCYFLKKKLVRVSLTADKNG